MIESTLIARIAAEEGLDPKLVTAFIQTESSGDAYAWRTESAYRYLWDVKNNRPYRKLTPTEANSEVAPGDFYAAAGSRNTEWIGQQASWGPMQVMGAVAREFGYKKHFPELCGEDGIRIGCKLLRKLFEKYQDRYGNEGVIAAYNAGTPALLDSGKFGNQSYVDKVMAVFHG
jgi:hypothetical protein